jgi:nuclear pore complex protein Nup205
MEALKDGAFDFMLSIAGDVKSLEWQDPARTGMRQWLQRKSPPLVSDGAQFSDFFQLCLMVQLETFVDAFISNLPDVLRKLRVEEDEQRQLSQAHEQDLDLERFLIIIAYSYEGRPDAAMNFWADPDSNLAGFMHWASRRASTPLVSAFCEMLQAISENEDCATSAHEFLLDEGHHSSGKLRRSQSLTWNQIFRELIFFSDKIREKPSTVPPQMYRTGKPSTEQAESEPESAMMLESYLRLITKLSSESETARQYLLKDPAFNLVDLLFQLASSQIPARLRACTFSALRALLTRKSQEDGSIMWQCLDSWMGGNYIFPAGSHPRSLQLSPPATMERIFDEISGGYEEPNAFVQLLTALMSPTEESSELHDSLPFPENLGSSYRMPGVELYVDFVMGRVFAAKSREAQDSNQLRMLRLSCLQFCMVCLSTFNEDLIVLGNETNILLDAAIATTDLATYVRLHPFARVMDWMFNDRVMSSLVTILHQDLVDVGKAPPDSPIILGILRAVEIISKVLELQATYLDLVRPMIKLQSSPRRAPVSNAAYASFEDGLVSHLNLVVDLGNYCGVGHPGLTLACLKLLESISTSSKIISSWSGTAQHSHRNKAIVAMEANGEYESVARSFTSDLTAPLDFGSESDSPIYMTKLYILEFLYSTLHANPNQPTIAHLLLGFKCGVDSLAIEPNGVFDKRNSLFHNLLRVLLETPCGDGQGMRQWLIALRYKSMRILRILWSSPLSAAIVVEELRENEVLFHLLLREVIIQPVLPWEGEAAASPQFPLTEGASALVDFLALRAMSLEYIAMELCSVTQNRMPTLKRRIFDALNGQVLGEGDEPIGIPTVFDLYDFILPGGLWDVSTPQLGFYKDLDIRICQEVDSEGNSVYNLDRVKEILLLKRSESSASGVVITAQDLAVIEREEAGIVEHLVATNRRTQVASQSLKVLRKWTTLLLVMIESNDFQGTAKISFLLQALQSILPNFEAFATERLEEALELAKLAKVLLFKLEISSDDPLDKGSRNVGNLVSEKLFQLFQICLQAIGKWAGNSDLRAVYYGICFRYLTGMVDKGPLLSGRQKTIKTIQVYGERLINVICDDAYGSDPACQTAALILLNALVHTGREENDSHVVEALNKLNFIGILVDSLRNVMTEWVQIVQSGSLDQRNYHDAKLALLLQLCQTREGAKHVLHANLFRSVELSGLFAADPELQIGKHSSPLTIP